MPSPTKTTTIHKTNSTKEGRNDRKEHFPSNKQEQKIADQIHKNYCKKSENINKSFSVGEKSPLKPTMILKKTVTHFKLN